MKDECESLKIRIMMEYSRLQQWGDATGLTDENRQGEYDRKMKINAALIEATLTEIRSELKHISKLTLQREELKITETDMFEETPQVDNGKGGIHRTNEKKDTYLKPVETVDVSKRGDITSMPATRRYIYNRSETQGSASRPKYSKQAINKLDLQKFNSIFDSPYIPQEKRRYHKGLDGVMSFAKGMKIVVTDRKRMKWALKDKVQVGKRVTRLKELTDFLHETIDDTQKQMLLETTQECWMALLQIQDTVGGMQKLLEAMQADDTVTNSAHQSGFDPGSTLVGSAGASTGNERIPEASKAVYERLAWFSYVATKDLLIPQYRGNKLSDDDSHQLRRKIPNYKAGVRTFASFQGRNVWVEWKRYEEASTVVDGGKIIRGPNAQTQNNIERLISLLKIQNRPAEFCVPSCIGYFSVSDKLAHFGIVYEFPDEIDKASNPYTLSDAFETKPPALQPRITIAQDIATCLMYLHAVNWLHKGIRSSNVLFPQAPGQDNRKMYISGLEYARPDEAGLTNKVPIGDLTGAEYIHPEYLEPNQRKGYRKTYDIYSMGIVLFEIAYWRPLKDILDLSSSADDPEKTLEAARGVRKRILKDDPGLLDYVRCTMGDRYHSAVHACLIGMEAFGLNDDLPQSDPAIAAFLQQAYMRVVIDVLKSIVV